MTGAYQKNLIIMPSGRKLNDYVAGFSADNYVRLRMKEGCINTRDIFEEIEVKGYTGFLFLFMGLIIPRKAKPR